MILSKLKNATRDQHDRTESTVDIMSSTFTIENYRSLIAKFYRFYSVMEPELERFDLSKYDLNFEDRRKLGLIRQDLQQLGLDPESIDKNWRQIPDLNGEAEAFGALYVIEGSTLGGQLIKRHLKETLRITPENGGAFFNGYGELTGPRWKEFGASITKFYEENGSEDAIIGAARATFDSFGSCFESEDLNLN